MNIKLLRKIEKYITEEPRRLNMVQWGAVFNPNDQSQEMSVCTFESQTNNNVIPAKITPKDLPPCGTVGCIAGTAWMLNQTPEQLEAYRDKEHYDPMGYHFYRLPNDTMSYSQEALGLNREQAERLFYIPGIHTADYGWPEKFAKQYLRAKTPRQRAKVTVARIEHFIRTKGEE